MFDPSAIASSILSYCDKIANNQPTVSSATIITTASIGLTATLILSDNPARKGIIIYNNSANSIYLAYGLTVNSGNHMTAILPTFNQWVMPSPIYTGSMSAIRNAGSGAVFITELTT